MLSLTTIFGVILASFTASADNDSVVDEINITVPVSCTLSGIGMNTHNAEINNGQYNSAIGETTLKAFCNDNEGFAIYAIGYTDNEGGKNVLTNSELGSTHDIETGTLTSGTDSQWAMKLSTISSPTPTYPITIQNSFDSFQEVPDDYTKVAYRTASTDTGTNAEGSTLKTTYQTYISPTQPAGTYTGQVKYIMVHPHTAPEPVEENQIGVIYHGNGLYFDQTETKDTNKVVYEKRYEDEYGYIGDTPTIMKSRNLSADGIQNGPYSENGGTYYEGNGVDPSYVGLEGASRIKMVVRYGLSANIGYIDPSISGNSNNCGELCDGSIDRAGTVTFIIDDSSASIYSEFGSSATNPGYDYGIYAQVYPVYDEPTEGANYGLVQEDVMSIISASGTYAETTTWNGYWCYFTPYNDVYTFWTEDNIKDYLRENADSLAGTTIDLYASNSYTVVFNANGGSGTMADQTIYPYQRTTLNDATFVKPHQDVISWNTKPDGTGESYPVRDTNYIYDPIADTKTGESVTLYAQWGDCAPNRICYDDNGANSPTAMGKQYAYSSLILWASNFQRSGYGFAGWNTKADGTGTYYGPNQNFNFAYGSLNNEGVRLYAIWVPSAGNLQNWLGCPGLNTGAVTALTDTRDNNTYTVAKLVDGNCWMVENLRLGDTSPMTLTTANTESAGTLPAGGSTSTSDTGQYLSIDNTHSTVAVMNGTNANIYAYGNGYSWPAAANTTDNIASGTVYTSICPAGWHLPYGSTGSDVGGGNTSGGFYYLGNQFGNLSNTELSNRWRSYPNNFILSYSYNSATVFTTYKNASVHDFSVYQSSVRYGLIESSQINSRSDFRAVRCVMNN